MQVDRAASFVFGLTMGILGTLVFQKWMESQDESFPKLEDSIEKQLERLEKATQMEPA